MSAGARAVVFACLAMLLIACETGPSRTPANFPPRRISLDVELPAWWIGGKFVVDGFTRTLRDELASYNIRSDVRCEHGYECVEVNLTLWENHHAIDVVLARGGQTTFIGRVLVADRSMTTLDVAAELVASVIAHGLPQPSIRSRLCRCSRYSRPSLTMCPDTTRPAGMPMFVGSQPPAMLGPRMVTLRPTPQTLPT